MAKDRKAEKLAERLEDIWDVTSRDDSVTGEFPVALGPFATLKSRRTVDQRFNALRLSKGPQLFVDWRFVQAGSLRWINRATKEVYPLESHDVEGPIDAEALPVDVPDGIRIASQKAEKSEPFKAGARAVSPGATIFQVEARYLSWTSGHHGEGMALVESADGWSWKLIGECTYDTSANPEAATMGESGIFLDPGAPPSERFKMIYRANPRGTEHAAFRRRILEEYARERPDDIDAVVANYKGKFSAMYGAVSSDGLHWTARKGPLIIQFSDTRNVVSYHPDLKRYIWYERNNWYYGRRCVGISISETFDRFPGPDMLLTPSLSDHPADDWYTNSKTAYPGTRDYHFMFPARYNRASESCDLWAFSSPDGLVWARMPPGPVLETGKPGSWDGGCLFGGIDLFTLGPDRVALPYTGYLYPHKYPRNAETMKFATAYAMWEKERISAVETAGPDAGSFSTYSLLAEGRRLRLNLATGRAGEVRIEVAGPDGKPLQGRSFDDCDPLTGDHADAIVRWRGQEDLARADGQPFVLRFRMRGAKIYAFEVI